MMSPVKSYPIVRYEAGILSKIADLVVREEPLALVLIHGPEDGRVETEWAVSMRTPGHDEELAMGYLYSEALIRDNSDVIHLRYCLKKEEESGNKLLIQLQPHLTIELSGKRKDTFLNSSCGVCGKQSIQQVFQQLPEFPPCEQKVDASVLLTLEKAIHLKQPVFRNTGGLHACSLFTYSGELVLQREDVGRHNALDKVIGAALIRNLIKPNQSNQCLVHLSGRAGFEMIQKAAMAGIKLVTSIGAPSSLAVDLAQKAGITLVGFLRDKRFNVYAWPENINFNS